MAWDEGLAQLLRDDLAGETIAERKMFGGLAFLLHGHMVCGIHKGGAMFRVGKGGVAAALGVAGARQMTMGDRPMAGMVGLSDDAVADDARRGQVMALALACVRALPPKEAVPRGGKRQWPKLPACAKAGQSRKETPCPTKTARRSTC